MLTYLTNNINFVPAIAYPPEGELSSWVEKRGVRKVFAARLGARASRPLRPPGMGVWPTPRLAAAEGRLRPACGRDARAPRGRKTLTHTRGSGQESTRKGPGTPQGRNARALDHQLFFATCLGRISRTNSRRNSGFGQT